MRCLTHFLKAYFKGDKMKTLQKYDIDVFEVTIGALIVVLGLSMIVEMYVRMF
jgi:hypothetical protein